MDHYFRVRPVCLCNSFILPVGRYDGRDWLCLSIPGLADSVRRRPGRR